MISHALRSNVRAPFATLIAAAALLTTAVAAGLITTFARTTQSEFVGAARRAWETPYDLLVRPAGSQTPMEVTDGLVRPNFMSGVHGGIDRQQLQQIRLIDGVEVAAPIAVVGFVNWRSILPGLSVGHGESGVFHVVVRSTGEAGLSSYPVDDRYVVVSRDGTFVPSNGRDFSGLMITPEGQLDCHATVQCFAARVCAAPDCAVELPNFSGFLVDAASYELFVMQPLLIAGIDPEAEAKLAGIDACVRTGRYLQTATDGPVDLGSGDDLERLPVLVSDRSFVDETLTATLSRATDPRPIFSGRDPAQSSSWIVQSTQSHSVDELYQSYLTSTDPFVSAAHDADPYPIWTSGDVAYEQVGLDRVRPIEVDTNLDIYRELQGGVGMAGPDVLIPPAARDVGFRDITTHADGYQMGPESPYRLKKLEPVGTYDPSCIPGWNPLAGGKLDAYSYPTVVLQDGRQLTPTRAIGGYLNSPPLLLTTLDSADWLSDPRRYKDQPGVRDISVIRVKVAGAETPSDAAEAQLDLVSTEIQERTGLEVDVVKGSSLAAVTVELPAGRFGRPAEVATEGWSKKGVVVRLVRGVDGQSIAMIDTAIAVSMIVVGTIAFASVRRRRREFALLRALGWPALRLAALVELEILLIGLAVGTVVLLGGLAGGRLLAPDMAPNFAVQSLVVIAVSAAAGIVPALSAYRGTAITALRGSHRIRRVGAPDSMRALALRELVVESPIESLLAVAMLAIGVIVLSLMTLIAVAFSGSLDATILGRHIAARAEPDQLVVAVVVLVFVAIEDAQLLMLTYIEKSRRLAVLRAIGWPASSITWLLAWQGMLLALAGAALGAVVSLFVGAALATSWGPLLVSVAAGAGAGLVATIVAELIVLWHVRGHFIRDDGLD